MAADVSEHGPAFDRLDEKWRDTPVTEGRPALAWVLGRGNLSTPGPDVPGAPYVGPGGGECAWCPFATETPGEPYPPNPADPGEGYYDCSLLNRHRIWGENPPCTHADWAARARRELAGAAPQADPATRGRRYVARLAVALREVGWPWLARDVDALADAMVAWPHRPPRLDPAELWAAIERADP